MTALTLNISDTLYIAHIGLLSKPWQAELNDVKICRVSYLKYRTAYKQFFWEAKANFNCKYLSNRTKFVLHFLGHRVALSVRNPKT